MNFGEHIKQRREKLNLSQKEVAKLLFVTRQTISNWENGRNFPDMSMLIELSKLYQISIDSLLKEDKKLKEHLDRDKTVKKYSPFPILISYQLGFWLIIEPYIHTTSLLSELALLGMQIAIIFMIIAECIFSAYIYSSSYFLILRFIKKHYLLSGLVFIIIMVPLATAFQNQSISDKSSFYIGIAAIILATVQVVQELIFWCLNRILDKRNQQ